MGNKLKVKVSVSAVLQNYKHQILCLKHNKCKGIYVLPAGKVKIDESEKEAICRELKEELDIKIDTNTLGSPMEIFTHYDRTDNPEDIYKEHIFLVDEAYVSFVNMEPSKHSDVRFFDMDFIARNPKLFGYTTWSTAIKLLSFDNNNIEFTYENN